MKDKIFNKSYLKKIGRLILTYVLCSIACIILLTIIENREVFSIKTYISSILSFKAAPYSWYVNMYIGLYLLIPFLNILWNNLKTKENKRMLLIVLIILIVLPTLLNIWNFDSLEWWVHPGSSNTYQTLIPNFWLGIGYPILYYFIGCYLKDYKLNISLKKNIALLFMLLILFGLFNYYRNYGYIFNWGIYADYHSFETVIITILLANLTLNKISISIKNIKIQKVISKISYLTFGAYLASAIFDSWYYPYLNNFEYVKNRLIYWIPLVLGVIISSLLLSHIISLIEKIIMKIIKNKEYRGTILFLVIEILFLFIIEFFNQQIITDKTYLHYTRHIFNYCWILIIIMGIYILKPKLRKIITIIINSLLIIISIVNYIMNAYFKTLFSFKDLILAGDGLSFISSIFKYISISLIIFIMISLVINVLLIRIKTTKMYKIKSLQTPTIIVLIIILIFCRNNTASTLTSSIDGWDSRAVLANINNYYTNWIEPQKLVQISGIYEYIIKDFYESFLKKENILEAKTKVTKYIQKNSNKTETINYNGIFKDKNLIFIMMESMDDWMINKNITPTIYEMMQHGFNFTNHYSPGYVTGDTANTEFIANTGMYPKINSLSPHYAYVNNSYPYSIANIFKSNGYEVNSFHRSNGFIYNRLEMHLSLGYNKYYNYFDMGISEENLDLDHYIIENSYNKIVSNNRFMSFIITYSPHDPYSYDKIECKENIEEVKKIYPKIDDEEILCSYSAARETDNMFKLLIENLKKDNKLEDTIIIAFSDHRNKAVSLNNEDSKLNKTAFFIYDSTMDNNQISTITSSINILPTIINLYGFNTNYIYPGYDALNNENGYVIFKDLTYFNGYETKVINQKMKNEIEYSATILISDYYKKEK